MAISVEVQSQVYTALMVILAWLRRTIEIIIVGLVISLIMIGGRPHRVSPVATSVMAWASGGLLLLGLLWSVGNVVSLVRRRDGQRWQSTIRSTVIYFPAIAFLAGVVSILMFLGLGALTNSFNGSSWPLVVFVSLAPCAAFGCASSLFLEVRTKTGLRRLAWVSMTALGIAAIAVASVEVLSPPLDRVAHILIEPGALEAYLAKSAKTGAPEAAVSQAFSVLGVRRAELRSVDEGAGSGGEHTPWNHCRLLDKPTLKAHIRFQQEFVAPVQVEFTTMLFLAYSGRLLGWAGYDRQKRLVDLHARLVWIGL